MYYSFSPRPPSLFFHLGVMVVVFLLVVLFLLLPTPVPHVLDSSATSFDTDDASVAVDVGAYPKTNSTS